MLFLFLQNLFFGWFLLLQVQAFGLAAFILITIQIIERKQNCGLHYLSSLLIIFQVKMLKKIKITFLSFLFVIFDIPIPF